jgi:hypothetical protein
MLSVGVSQREALLENLAAFSDFRVTVLANNLFDPLKVQNALDRLERPFNQRYPWPVSMAFAPTPIFLEDTQPPPTVETEPSCYRIH